MERNSFIFYDSFYKAISKLKPEEQALCLQALCEYSLKGTMPTTDNPIVTMFFELIKPQIDTNNQRYENGCKGGRPQKPNRNQTKTKPKPKHNQTITKPKPNDNDNVNVNDNDNVNKEKEIKKEKDLQAQQPPAVVPSKPIKPHQRLYNYFAAKYKQATGIDYLGKSQDFVALATLEKKFGVDMVKQKIDWFYIGCKNAVFWFTKDINDFVIGKLQSHWNEIIPKLTEEQKQQQKENEEREKHKARLRARGIEC